MNKWLWLSGAITASKAVHSDLEGICLNRPTIFSVEACAHRVTLLFMPDAMNVQIFGIKKSNGTRAAERFFKERRVPIQMVDLHKRPMAQKRGRLWPRRWSGNRHLRGTVDIVTGPALAGTDRTIPFDS
jgi:hypothetical protein